MKENMITVGEVLETVDALVENSVPDSVKIGWINELELKVQSEIFRSSDVRMVKSEGDVLSVPRAFARAYSLYLKAMIELYRGDEKAYDVADKEFKSAYTDYAKYFLRTRT